MSSRDRRPSPSAAWWRATLPTRPVLGLLGRFVGRWSVALSGAGAGLVLPSCADLMVETEPAVTPSALETQRQDGWNVGSEESALSFPGAQPTDVAGRADWRDDTAALALRLGPSGRPWAPYYNPTLFQSLEAPRNADLRAAVWPVFSPDMADAAARGEALLSLLVEDGVCRRDVAVVLDLAGPASVALAAALAPCLEPVFVFGNWPHPMGVVPAHLTLGAVLYELPAFERARATRTAPAAPVFVLDRNRLSPYVDDAGAFDNRYFVGLPPHEALRQAGIAHILYVTGDAPAVPEADDLNDDLVALDESGLDVQLLALSDFSETPLPDWPEVPAYPGATPPPTFAGTGPHFYFGGSSRTHACFWQWYGWPRRGVAPSPSPSLAALPARLASRCHFHPAPRAGFAVAAHARGAGVHVSGFGLGRSGSLGRAHTGMSG